MTLLAAHRRRKCVAVTRATSRLRALCDSLLWVMYDDAERTIDLHASLGLPWVQVRLPDTCDVEMGVRWAEVVAYGAQRGFTQFRPGGPSGHGCHLVRLERATAAPWPTPDDITEDVT